MGRRCDREGLPPPGSGRSRWGIPPPCRCAGDRSQRHGDEKSGEKNEGCGALVRWHRPRVPLRGNSNPAFPPDRAQSEREARPPRTAIHSYWRPLRTVIEYICNRLDNIQSHGSAGALLVVILACPTHFARIFCSSQKYSLAYKIKFSRVDIDLPVVDPKSTCRAGKATPYIRIRTQLHNLSAL